MLTPADLLNLANDAIQRRVISRDPHKGTVTLVDLDDSAAAAKQVTITQGQLQGRVEQAAMIMFAESGGDTQAVCYNYDGPDGKPTCSKVPLPVGTKGTQRGVDRGLWQFNSVSFPKVTDLIAFDQYAATEYAYRQSQGFNTWGPWSRSNGLPTGDPVRYKNIREIFDYTVNDMEGGAVLKGWTDDVTDLGGAIADGAVATAKDIKDALPDWTKSLGRLLARLVDPAFWRRFGTGALGVLFVLIALALTVAAAKLS